MAYAGGSHLENTCKSKSSAPTSMHSMWIPRASFEELPGVKEDLSWHPLAAWLFAYGGSGGSQSSGKRKEDHTEEQGAQHLRQKSDEGVAEDHKTEEVYRR